METAELHYSLLVQRLPILQRRHRPQERTSNVQKLSMRSAETLYSICILRLLVPVQGSKRISNRQWAQQK